MKYEKNRKIFGLDEFTFLKYIKLLIIPIIIIILIIIFLSLNLSFKQKKSKKIENNLTTSKSEFKPTDKLRLNDNEAINNLFLEYQKARTQGDLSKLSSLFLNSEENNLDSEELKNKLSEAAKLFEGFTSDTEIYLADGKAVGEYVAFAKMNIKFKKIDNPLPMILEAYIVSKDGEYKFIDKNSLDNEQKIRLEAVASTTDVQNMYKALKKNIESLIVDDVELADKYKDFVDGDIKLKDPKLTQESLDAKKSNSEKDDVIQESTANDVEGSDAADQSE